MIQHDGKIPSNQHKGNSTIMQNVNNNRTLKLRRHSTRHTQLQHRAIALDSGDTRYQSSQHDGMSNFGEYALLNADIADQPVGMESTMIGGIPRYWFDWYEMGDCTNIALAVYHRLSTTEQGIDYHRELLNRVNEDEHHWNCELPSYCDDGFKTIRTAGAPVKQILQFFDEGIISQVDHVAAFRNGEIWDLNGEDWQDQQTDAVYVKVATDAEFDDLRNRWYEYWNASDDDEIPSNQHKGNYEMQDEFTNIDDEAFTDAIDDIFGAILHTYNDGGKRAARRAGTMDLNDGKWYNRDGAMCYITALAIAEGYTIDPAQQDRDDHTLFMQIHAEFAAASKKRGYCISGCSSETQRRKVVADVYAAHGFKLVYQAECVTCEEIGRNCRCDQQWFMHEFTVAEELQSIQDNSIIEAYDPLHWAAVVDGRIVDDVPTYWSSEIMLTAIWSRDETN